MNTEELADDCNHAWPNMAGIEGKCFNCGKTWHEAIIESEMIKITAYLKKKLNGEEISHGHTIEPTEDMWEAGYSAGDGETCARAIYKAMIEAAPKKEGE